MKKARKREGIYVQLCLAICGYGGSFPHPSHLFPSEGSVLLRTDAKEKADLSAGELGDVPLGDRLDRSGDQSVCHHPEPVNSLKK